MENHQRQQTLDQIRQTDIDFSDYASQFGVAAAFDKFCSNNVLHISESGFPTVGKEPLVQQLHLFQVSYTMSWTPQMVNLNPDGITGVTKGKYNLYEINPEGEDEKKLIGNGQYLTVWQKQQDDTWKAIYDMDGGIFQSEK